MFQLSSLIKVFTSLLTTIFLVARRMVKEASLIRFGPRYFSAMLCVSASTELSKVNERFSHPYKTRGDWSKPGGYSKIFVFKEISASFEGLNLYPGHVDET